MTKMGMMFVGAWAGEQLLVVSGTGVIIGEDLFEGQSWTMGVVLRVTVGPVDGGTVGGSADRPCLCRAGP